MSQNTDTPPQIPSKSAAPKDSKKPVFRDYASI